MNTLEREHIGRLIRRFAAGAATDDLLILIAETDGLLERTPGRIAPTRRGQRYLNRLLQGFLPE